MTLDLKKICILSMAVFSMFFGAGNTIYPIVVAIAAKSQFSWSFIGLFLTSICGPLLGLVGGALYQGKALDFFSRAGEWPGILLMLGALALLGPFAVLPRCVSVAYAAMSSIGWPIPLLVFSVLFGLVALFACIRQKNTLATLGSFLSPLLIGCLLLIIIKGSFFTHGAIALSSLGKFSAFKLGVSTGYDTMDLIASIIFSAGIWAMVQKTFSKEPKQIFKVTLLAGAAACVMLALVYFGIGYVAMLHSAQLAHTALPELMSKLAVLILGVKLAIVAHLAVALACLTTVIGLTMTLSQIITQELTSKLSYKFCTISIIGLTTLMTLIGFATISHWIHSVISILYPLIILLTLYNITAKLWKSSKSMQDPSLLL